MSSSASHVLYINLLVNAFLYFNLYLDSHICLCFSFQGKQNPSEIYPPRPESIGAIMYTSGTSGAPKGVVLTHENAAYGVRGIDLFMEQFEDKVNMEYDEFMIL